MIRSKIVAVSVLAAVIAVTGCASKKGEEPAPPREIESAQKTAVIEHKGTSLGINDLPLWVDTYVSQGILGLEAMPEYKDFYCFVGENTGTNLNSLLSWVTGFNISQEMARTISTKVQALFVGAATGSPEAAYGSYFENVVKTTSEASFSGARKVNDWWVYVRYYNDDGKTVQKNEYRAFVLTIIPKAQLDQQVMNIINGVDSSAATPEQLTAIDRVKAVMSSEGFLSAE
ncbi:MAG: hypothetical protein LBR47_04355 [Spirochaetaceae bacterium]|jgi:hypothetical protein|nr:hypothetical protein [Spirochaetaceae bacterium]